MQAGYRLTVAKKTLYCLAGWSMPMPMPLNRSDEHGMQLRGVSNGCAGKQRRISRDVLLTTPNPDHALTEPPWRNDCFHDKGVSLIADGDFR